jgi:hypothetical protein
MSTINYSVGKYNAYDNFWYETLCMVNKNEWKFNIKMNSSQFIHEVNIACNIVTAELSNGRAKVLGKFYTY